MCCYYAAGRLKNIYALTGKPKHEIEELVRKRMKYLGQAAADKDFANGNQRYYMEEMLREYELYNRMPKNGDILLRELESNPDTDLWIRLVIQGLSHVSKGWDVERNLKHYNLEWKNSSR
ncbi:unnamed protein product [marine sediment metagenome]|uniref:Uncharacterized protein n=1 Tax=marine sediment metagenome TaxID=412755 RepID=X1QUU7_9ZZZZ